ncbi:HAD family phosphatase [bacterium]|nr:HAD family phosphatase [bacterium]RQV98553.1 MAG: HAD family phosphatase [bacterium]
MLRAVIFDMDGVIVDSEPIHLFAEKSLLAKFGISVTDEEIQSYMGKSLRFLLKNFIDRYHLNTSVEKLYAVQQKTLFELYDEKAELLPGLLDLLKILKDDHIDMAVASSSSRALISLVLKKFHLSPYLKVIVSGEEVKKPKPNPDIFLETVSKLGYHPSECVVIEDSTAGVQAAKSAGTACVGFRSPHSGNQDLKIADIIVDDLSSLNIQKLKALMYEIK